MAPPPAHPLLTAFLNTIPRALNSQNPHSLSIIFNTSLHVLSSKPLQSLRTVLLPIPAANLRAQIEAVLTDDWLSLNEAVLSYLDYLTSADPRITHSPQPPPDLLAITTNYFNKLHAFLASLSTAFNTPRGSVLSHAVKLTARNAVNAANHLDHLANSIHRPHTSALLNTLVKTFNSSLAERTSFHPDGSPKLGKKAAMLDLANCLFKVYLKLQEHRLVTTILDNLSACGVPLDPRSYGRAALATYYYYRGVHELHNTSFLAAKHSLETAYDHCATAAVAQRRRILIPLLAVAVILGLLPRAKVFDRPEAVGLRELFTPLYVAVRKGDFALHRQALGVQDSPTEDTAWRRAFWERNQLFWLLYHRLHPQIWRSLVRRVHLLTVPQGAGASGPPQVWLEDVLVAARCGWEGYWPAGEMEVGDVESVVWGLLDMGWVKGYLARMEEGTVVVLSRTEAWPAVWGVFEGPRWREEEVVGAPEQGGGRVVRLKGAKAAGS